MTTGCPLNVAGSDEQFARQAAWTRAVRSQLYRRVNLLRARRVLDVGCGSGVVTEELAARTRGQVIAIDVDAAMIAAARARGGRAVYQEGDACRLPFPDGHFDVVVCHFLLMWVDDPARAVCEMARVTRPGGAVLVCGEPDYGGRVDWPDLPIGQWQAAALQRQGADPFMPGGRGGLPAGKGHGVAGHRRRHAAGVHARVLWTGPAGIAPRRYSTANKEAL